MSAGRPTKYTPEMCGKVDEYLRINKDTYEEDRLRVKLPTKEGFALFIDITKRTLYNWADEHKEFFHALEKIEKVQHERLLNSGLAGEYNSTIAKLILSSNHNYKERTDQTTKDKELPQPLLYALRNNDSDKKDSEAEQED